MHVEALSQTACTSTINPEVDKAALFRKVLQQGVDINNQLSRFCLFFYSEFMDTPK
jgi:hypothetical protein